MSMPLFRKQPSSSLQKMSWPQRARRQLSFVHRVIPCRLCGNCRWRAVESVHHGRRSRCATLQCWTLVTYQFVADLEDCVTVYKFIETFSIGMLAGLVWYGKGAENTQTALGEVIGLLFFTTALFTVSTVFQALTATSALANLCASEYASGLYSVVVFDVAAAASSMFTLAIWAPLWQMMAYAIVEIGASPSAMVAMHVALILNVFAMRTIGLCLGMVVPSASLNVVIGNIFAQGCMLTNGFYTKLPEWFQPVTFVSIPRYTFRALLKIEFSWHDTFEVNPQHGLSAFGLPSRYIPAELTQSFQLLADREMAVMQSPLEASISREFFALGAISAFFLMLLWVALKARAVGLEAGEELFELPCSAWQRMDVPNPEVNLAAASRPESHPRASDSPKLGVSSSTSNDSSFLIDGYGEGSLDSGRYELRYAGLCSSVSQSTDMGSELVSI